MIGGEDSLEKEAVASERGSFFFET